MKEDEENPTVALLHEQSHKPRANITFWNFLSVGWLTPLLWSGAKNTLTLPQLYRLPIKNESEELAHILDSFWIKFRSENYSNKKKPSLFLVMFLKYWKVMFGVLLFNGLSVACMLILPTFLEDVILYLTPGYPKEQLLIDSGVGLAFILALLQIGTFLFVQTATQLSVTLQVDFKTVLIGAVYEKSFRLSQKSSQTFTSGKILNLINVDIEKVSLAFVQASQLFTAPIHVTVSIILLGKLIGVAVWAGAGALFAILLIQVFILGFLISSQKRFLAGGDKRLKTIREILYGIKIIKFRALEEFFLERVNSIRTEQLNALSTYYIVQAFFVGFIQIAPISMPISAFLVYAAMNGSITAQIIFPALTLFQGLFQPILTIPQAVTSFAVAVVSWNRIVELLFAEEAVVGNENKSLEKSPSTTTTNGIEIAVTAVDASYKWENISQNSNSDLNKNNSATGANAKNNTIDPIENESNLGSFSLNDLSFNIPVGSKVAIVGPVGSGKSSLLSAMIGEMPKLGGSITMSGKISYCSQQPWILTDTIRGNIVFNQNFDAKKLQRVVEVCGLQDDLSQLPAGIDTEIGEKGVNLSGGQKARVALARALYFAPDIILLDDPISALDAQVGLYVFNNAIKDYLKEKTVILVTHQLHLLPEMDQIFVLENSKIKEQGSYRELINKTGSLLSVMMKDYHLDDENSMKTKNVTRQDAVAAGEGGIIISEDQEKGTVDSKVYFAYFEKCGGWIFYLVVLVAAILNSGTQVFNNLWLQWWISGKYDFTNDFWMLWYGLIGLIQFGFGLMINAVFLIGCYQAVKYYHPQALKVMLNSTIGFFDSQPIGRILNRFSKDVESVDQNLIMLFLTTIGTAGSLSALAFLCYVDQRMIILAAPLLFLYFFMLKYFQKSNIELKRFEATRKSPLYSHVSETLTGLATVKAYGVENGFISRQRKLMDDSNSPTFLRLMAGVWMSLRLGIISSSLTFLLSILGVYSAIEASLVGVALVYALAFANSLGLLLFSVSQLENEFNSIERLQYYCNNLPQEKAAILPSDPKSDVWPTKGVVKFNNVSLSYPSRPDVRIIDQLSFEIKAGEKIGIVGRTGSGKSTLMSALFRIIELEEGCIEIDGQDISKLGLKTLRKSIQIIPQEPVLFSGNIRENLDVTGSFPDTQLWEVLNHIGLKTFVESLPNNLDAPVLENGDNLSVGQRQLICLGRAILFRPRILIMDEATASVDREADKLIQESIKTMFKETTVISIAHRLNTIADFDRVLVLSNGKKMEFDTPYNLLANSNSIFSELADATGTANAALLRNIAKEHMEHTN